MVLTDWGGAVVVWKNRESVVVVWNEWEGMIVVVKD